jgi:hypothetical protein
LPPLISAETDLAFLLSEANLRQWTAFCTKNATYMAKVEFNTGIETLTIFLVSIAKAISFSKRANF